MTQILAVSKATLDVLSITSPNDFIFKSDLNTFKILAQGVLTSQTVDANPKTFSVAHGLSDTPIFFAFAEFPDGKTAMPDNHDFTEQYNVAAGYGAFTTEVDATNIYFIFTRPGSNYNVNIKWYAFEAPL